MRGLYLPVIFLCLLNLNACPKGEKGVGQPQPAPTATSSNSAGSNTDNSPPDPVKKHRRRVMAISPQGEKLEAHRLKSGNTPYRGMYSELDEWVWDNYDSGEEDLAVQGKPAGENNTLRALYVTEGGYVIPNLEALRFELDRRQAGKPPGAKAGPFALYAIGVLPDELRDQNLMERAKLTARYMPPIPMWLGTEPPYWSLVLPDGSVVFKGILGEGRAYFPVMDSLHLLDGLKVSHYSVGGRFIDQTEPGQLWCELFFPEFEAALERHGIGRGNVREFGLYLQFLNLADQTKTAYYYYDGTPISASEIKSNPDYNGLFEMYGKFLPAMYISQQKKGR